MWFIFPQIFGLGTSPMAQKYAITGIDEAKAYLNHPLLGFRLRECTQLVNEVNGRSIDDIFSLKGRPARTRGLHTFLPTPASNPCEAA